jgi:hypothetical protein
MLEITQHALNRVAIGKRRTDTGVLVELIPLRKQNHVRLGLTGYLQRFRQRFKPIFIGGPEFNRRVLVGDDRGKPQQFASFELGFIHGFF